ncbi:hypothetical protein PILCRDRAFT_112743 [Piloderma croceum F 1598]|uniref:F-box domain-containing protein n=1 Tax=Piloderma croceum (strain F 1598) TaxID=765440 RepID=A0A0C3G7E8_PILCF|nr:hypothetical protein PILCRDRAFT_112743 [Piloderma croceum F 1598]
MLERCPPELARHIFQLACTDTGYTGRSLSLVSRYIHATSKPVKLRCICVRGLRQMEAFATILENTAPEFRRVRDLCITDHRKRLFAVEGEIITEEVVKEMPIMVTEDAKVKVTDLEDVRSDALRRIISMVAPSIVTLSIYFAVCARAHCKIPFPLPRLVELTTLLNFKTIDLAVFTLESFRPYPSLRRWNTNGLNVYPDYLFGHITRVAPALTHLRLANIVECSEGLERALDPHYKGWEERVMLPLTITKVIIQPSTLWDLEFSRIIFAKQKGRIVLENYSDNTIYGREGAEEAEKQWLDRIHGGRGCWKAPKKGRLTS